MPTAAVNSLSEYSASPLMLIGGSLCPAENGPGGGSRDRLALCEGA